MILLPHVDYRREKVRIIFEGFWLDPRHFTVNVRPKEKRGYKKDSNFFLRSLKEVTEDITNTLVEMMDFCKAFVGLKVKNDDYRLIIPLITRLLEAVAAAKDGAHVGSQEPRGRPTKRNAVGDLGAMWQGGGLRRFGLPCTCGGDGVALLGAAPLALPPHVLDHPVWSC
jgi:hypothetical protein